MNIKQKFPILICLSLFFGIAAYVRADIAIRDPKPLRARLEEIRERRKLPAIAASVVIGNDVVAASAVGLRKWGEDVPVTRDDAFELGSISKPVTGTLMAILKDQGKINWNTTIGEMFPEMFPGHYKGYKKITVRHLMSHTSGLPYQPMMSQTEIDAKAATIIEQRLAYVSAALADKPAVLPGTAYVYSGGGIIAASMAEKSTGKSWETLVTELLFLKLHMHTAGFGSMATPPDLLDGPWYHQNRDGEIVPLSPVETKVFCRSPVGGVHCSVIDLGRFAAFHLVGMQGGLSENKLIKQSTFKEMYRVVEIKKLRGAGARYTTVGWRVQPTKWANGPVYWHSGQSRGRGYAVVHIIPDQNYATCVMMNIGGKEAAEAAGEINLFIVEALRDANYDPSNLFPKSNRK